MLSCFALASPQLLFAQDRPPLAAPGLSIPSTAAPWALDNFEGHTELIPIHHATVTMNRHTGKNIAGSLAGSLFYHPEMTTELAGEHARAQLHTAMPVLYFHVEDQDSGNDADSGDKYTFEIVPARVEGDRRIVSAVSFNQLTTHAKRKSSAAPTTTENLGHGWYRMTPKAPLTPGEYVLLYQPARAEEFATTVYPFGVDPKAPEAVDAVRTSTSSATATPP